MPNPVLKYVTVFEDNDGWGWTETHYQQAGSANPNLGTALGNFVAGFVPLRAALLPTDVAIVGTRVSYPRAGAIASLANRVATAGNPDWSSLPSNVSLALQMQNADATSKKIVHMRGLPTVINANGDYIEDATFKPRLDSFVSDGLVGGNFGWPTKDLTLSTSGVVTSYAVDATPQVTFTVNPTFNNLAPLVGLILPVRFSRLNSGKSALNRTLLCLVVNATTLITIDQVAAAPFLAKGRFNIRVTTFVRYNQQGSKSLGQRAPGRPLNRQPGRSRAKPLA